MTYDPMNAIFAKFTSDPRISPAFKQGFEQGVTEYERDKYKDALDQIRLELARTVGYRIRRRERNR